MARRPSKEVCNFIVVDICKSNFSYKEKKERDRQVDRQTDPRRRGKKGRQRKESREEEKE